MPRRFTPPRVLGCTSVFLASAAVAAQGTSTRASAALERRRTADAAADQGLFNDHAETLRAGEVAFTVDEVLLLGFGVGLTDRLQLSASMVLPVFGFLTPLSLFPQAKYALYRDGETTVSGRVGTGFAANVFVCDGCKKDWLVPLWSGLAVDHALDRRGDWVLHAAIDGGLFATHDETVGGGLLLFEGGLTSSLDEGLALMLEFTHVQPVPDDSEDALTAFTYGLRFHSPAAAFDLGFVWPFGLGADQPLLLGIPWVSLALRP